MRPYDYHAATSVEEALDHLARYGDDAAVMAGGTSLVILMKQGLVRPAHVVGVRGIGALRGIAQDDGALRLGAVATIREVERSPLVRKCCAALADAFGEVATVRIRNQATVGGALAHADPAQDPPVMLSALGAEVEARSSSGSRRIPLDEFFVDVLATALAPGELVTGVRVPAPPSGARAVYLKFLPRTEDDYATVSVGAVATRDAGGKVTHLRVALGACGPTVLRARGVEDALLGARPVAKRIAEAAALARDAVDPFADARGSAAYKREMARVWTERALRTVLA